MSRRALSVAVADLIYLEKAVALVLGFVGLKLGAEVAGLEISSALSLGFIVSTLGGGVLLSLLADAEKKDAHSPRGPAVLASSVLEQLRSAASELRAKAQSSLKGDEE